MDAIKELSDSNAAQDDPIKVNPDRDLIICLFVISLNDYEESMAVLKSMTKIIHFKDAFVNRATHLMKGVIFDSFYLEVSLKYKTR